MKSPLHLADKEALAFIGILAPTVDERPATALTELEHQLDFSRALGVMLESCTGCGACARACHSYLGTDDFFNIPAARAGLVRAVYRRHLTVCGRLKAKLTGAPALDAEMLQRWVDYFFQCNACRRCALFCPLGIDSGEIVLAGRNILARAGMASAFMAQIAFNELSVGNNTGIQKDAIQDSCSFLEEELKEETGMDIAIPVDQTGSDILYLPSSSELFSNVETLMGAAKLFHFLGLKWTLSSQLLEAANYGFLFDLNVMKKHNRRMQSAAAAVGATTVIVGECGHGWRVARMCSEGASGKVPFRLTHVLDFLAERLTALPLRKLPMRATLHDPCNYGRGAGLLEAPRALLRACVEEFVEMTPNRQLNFCCGGGSGLLMEEMKEIRMKLGQKKAEQVRALLPLDYLALPCASCKAQVPLVLQHYGMAEVATGGILDLLGKALQL
jgi:Fe-S oxidoreductase